MVNIGRPPLTPVTTLPSQIQTGTYYMFRGTRGNTNVAVVANTLYGVPVLIPRNITVDRIAIDVQNAGASETLARLGLYYNGTNMYPGTLLLDAGTVAVDTTGVKVITISQALSRGFYWAALVSNGAPTVRAHNSPELHPLGLSATDFSTLNTALSVSFTYAALPTPFTASGTANATTAYAISLRVLSLD